MPNHKAYFQKGKIVIVSDGRRMEMNMTPGQYGQGIKAFKHGAPINEAFPFLTADEREFLATSTKASEWIDVEE